jgi:hypothetical protein
MNEQTLINKIEKAGWEVLGIGFKESRSETCRVGNAKEITEESVSKIIPWYNWALFQCATDSEMYWVCQKEA